MAIFLLIQSKKKAGGDFLQNIQTSTKDDRSNDIFTENMPYLHMLHVRFIFRFICVYDWQIQNGKKITYKVNKNIKTKRRNSSN